MPSPPGVCNFPLGSSSNKLLNEIMNILVPSEARNVVLQMKGLQDLSLPSTPWEREAMKVFQQPERMPAPT